MRLPVDDYDEELHDDLIKLFFDEDQTSGGSLHDDTAKKITKSGSDSDILTIDLTSSTNSDFVQMPKPVVTKIDICYKVKHLAVQLVDLKKFPWYYKKFIKHYIQDSDITKGIVVGDKQNVTSDICMKMKYDTNKGQWKVHERNTNTLPRKRDTVIPKTVLNTNLNKIDYKRNKGLVGMTITHIIKQEKVYSSSEGLKSEDKILNDTHVESNDAGKSQNNLIDKKKSKIAVLNKAVPPNATKSKTNEMNEDISKDLQMTSKNNFKELTKSITSNINKSTTKDKSKDAKITEKQNEGFIKSAPSNSTKFKTKVAIEDKINDLKMLEKKCEVVMKSQPTALLIDTNKHKENFKAFSQSITTNIHIVKDRLESSTKKSDSHQKVRIRPIKKKKRKSADCEKQPKQHDMGNNDRRETNITTNSSVKKNMPVSTLLETPKDISSVPLVSERKITVINSTTKKFQDIKNFVERATKYAATNTLKQTDIQIQKCDKSKPLDMPILTNENEEKLDMPIQTNETEKKLVTTCNRRMSLKDSIIFEKDFNSKDLIGRKMGKENNTVPIDQQTLETDNAVPAKQTQNSSIAENVSTTCEPTTVESIPVVSHVSNVSSKPRIKHTPVTRPHATPPYNNDASRNKSDYGRYSVSVPSRPSTANHVDYNNQNRNILQLLNAPPMPFNNPGLIQHQLPVQRMSHLCTPPYHLNYVVPPGYATPARNGSTGNNYKMYQNNGSDANRHVYYDSMYKGYVPTPHNPPPPYPTQPSTPQSQTNYKQNPTLLCNPKSLVIDSTRYENIRPDNVANISVKCNDTLCTIGDNRVVTLDSVQAYIENPKPRYEKQLDKTPVSQPLRPSEVKAKGNIVNVSEFFANGSTSDSPMTKKAAVKRPLSAELERNLDFLAKRSKTTPLPVSTNVMASTYSPPILPIPTYETIMSKIYTTRQPTKATDENVKNGKAKCAKRKMPVEPLDKAKKISLEEYKNRFGKSESADLNSLVARSIDNTKGGAGLVSKYRKKSKDGNYSLEQDLGYSSDTNIRL